MLQAIKKVEQVIHELGRRGFAVASIDMSSPAYRPSASRPAPAACS
jgi:hypothetical protein